MPDLQQRPDVSAATPINRILAQAAAAAFANRRDEAHEFLQQAIRQAPSSSEVWLACAALPKTSGVRREPLPPKQPRCHSAMADRVHIDARQGATSSFDASCRPAQSAQSHAVV